MACIDGRPMLQAKALGIDLFPRPTGSTEDVPVYDRGQQAGSSAQPQQQQGPQPQYPQGPQYPGAVQGQYGGQQYGQQGQYQQYGGRPGSARPAPSGPHPFDLPQNYGQQPQRQPVVVSALLRDWAWVIC